MRNKNEKSICQKGQTVSPQGLISQKTPIIKLWQVSNQSNVMA